MSRDELKELWREALASPSETKLDEIANSVAELYLTDPQFRAHISNRSKRVTERTGIGFDPDRFGLESARAFVADEIGFESWTAMLNSLREPDEKPFLFHYAVAAMDRGDFTAFEEAVGSQKFHDRIVEWFEKGYFVNEKETIDEIFAAACMLGQTGTAAFLLDSGVEPYAGMKTGLSGFHYAASSGRLEVIKLLIERGLPMEVKNMYGGTVFGQAIWSAIHEHTADHARIVEALAEAGAVVDEGYPEWWAHQEVPDGETKERNAKILARHAEFQNTVSDARRAVTEAEGKSDQRLLADSLRAFGNILRRPPFLRDQANAVYERAACVYKDIGLPLEEAWVKRHI